MKKTFLFIFFVLFLTASASAYSEKSLVVTSDDGKTQTFLLSACPEVSIDADRLIIASGSSVVEYALSDVMTFTFAETSGIPGVQNAPEVVWQDDAVVFAAVADVEAYNAAGVRIDLTYTKSSHSVIVPISSLPKGVTILRAGNKNIKICK